MKKLSYIMKSTLMRFGIEGMLTSTIKHYLFSERWLKEYNNRNLHMKESARDVPLGRISRNHSQATTTDLRRF
jgi:hypothetical protein